MRAVATLLLAACAHAVPVDEGVPDPIAPEAVAHVAAASLALEVGHLDGAEAHLATAARRDRSAAGRAARARVWLTWGDGARALEVLGDADDPAAAAVRAEYAARVGDWATALAWIDRADVLGDDVLVRVPPWTDPTDPALGHVAAWWRMRPLAPVHRLDRARTAWLAGDVVAAAEDAEVAMTAWVPTPEALGLWVGGRAPSCDLAGPWGWVAARDGSLGTAWGPVLHALADALAACGEPDAAQRCAGWADAVTPGVRADAAHPAILDPSESP